MLKNLVVAGFLRIAYTIGALFEFKKCTGIKIWKGAIQKIGYLTLSPLEIFVLIKMLLKNVSQLHSAKYYTRRNADAYRFYNFNINQNSHLN
jgi:hypothetical protein